MTLDNLNNTAKGELIPGIPNIYGEKIIDLFKLTTPHCQPILFGSRAKGTYREGSDIDIALKGEQISSSDRDLCLSKYFDLNLPWRLDVVIYKFISEPALKEHIDRVGKVLLPRMPS